MPKIIDKIKEILKIKNIAALAFSLFQISYIFILIRAFASKLIVLLFILPVVFFNFAFIKYIDKNKIDFTAKWKKIKFYSAAAIISIILCKSISINIFNLSQGVLSIPAGLGLMAFCYQAVIFIIYSMEKVNLETKRPHKKYALFLYLIPSLVIFTLLYLVYFPGVHSMDSLVIWTDIGNNIYNDAHPLVYLFLIKLLRILWNDIAVVTLFNMLISAFTFAFIANELDRLGLPKWAAWAVAIALPLFPANALYAVTMWKDIPYTMGLLMLSMLLLRCFTSDYYYTKKALPQLFFVSLFTLFMRHNALLSVFLSLFILGVNYLIQKDKKLIIKTLILGVALIVSYYGIKNISIGVLSSSSSGGEFSGESLIYYTIPPTIAQQQIIYTEDAAGTSFTPEEKEMFARVFKVEGLAAHKEKYSENDIWMYYHKPGDTVLYDCTRMEFWQYYLHMWTRFPRSMAMGYQKITSIIWSSSTYGSVAYRGTNDDINIEGVEPYVFRPVIKKFMDAKLYRSVFNYSDSSLSVVFWRPALAFILSLILLLIAKRKHGKAAWFVFIPVFLNQITYLIVIASQDTRYTYVNYAMFMIMLALAVLKPKQIKTEQRPNDKSEEISG
jgi:hypothetical protein